MHARSTTFRGRPERLEAGIAVVREEVLPALRGMDGFVGLSLLVDRDSGACIATTAWESEEAMRRTAPAVGRLRDRAEGVLGGRPEVREWEIAVLHRVRPVPPGACARVTWTRAVNTSIDEQLFAFRIGTLPQVEDLPGFCSASALVDRGTGRAAVAVVYDSPDRLARSRGPAGELRASAVEQLGAQVLDVAELEVAIAHLRVPATS